MRRRLMLCGLLLCAPAIAAADRLVDTDGKPLQKPSLYIYSAAAWCVPCQRLKVDLDADRDFKAALMERYVVRIYDYDAHKGHAQRAGVKALPSFFTADQHWEGYTGKEELARRLKLDWRPAVVTPARASDPVAPPPVDAAQAVDVSQALEASHERWATTQQDLERVRRELDALKRRELPAVLQKAREIARNAAQALPADPKPETPDVGSGFGQLVVWGLSQAGWTLGPIGGLAVGVGLPLAYRALRRRLGTKGAIERRPPVTPIVVATDTPPDTAVVTRTEYVPYTDETLQDALAWARRETTRKHPGAVGNLELFESLVQQFLSGVGRAKRAE